MPVDGRFEHIVLSCNMTSDHAINRILTESQRTIDASSLQLHSLNISCDVGEASEHRIYEYPHAAENGATGVSIAKDYMEEHKAAFAEGSRTGCSPSIFSCIWNFPRHRTGFRKTRGVLSRHFQKEERAGMI
ncbi:hypothetical protein RND71_007300 [Anisodus tanguticus]|uniref:Uncharacterized protein n=1 Tax=Anisodus tanguticus TaxID=243964 RepID=A0AAE1SNG6_9SOLA|nr:hypothetical protein RND71_007300 [Anisodus tanguticus]